MSARVGAGCPVRGALVTAAVALWACSSSETILIELDLAGGDPFAGVVTVRMRASGPGMQELSSQIAYERGAEVRLPVIPSGKDRVIRIEGIDLDGLVVSRGESNPFEVSADRPARITIRFARCSEVGFPDLDGDGFGDGARQVTACDRQPGFVTNGDDCDDDNRDVRPDQTAFFTTSASAGFDYDCDNQVEPEVPDVADCAAASPPACDGQGWAGAVPACGETGSLIGCRKKGNTCEEVAGETRSQACR